jgi:hypothetical protein
LNSLFDSLRRLFHSLCGRHSRCFSWISNIYAQFTQFGSLLVLVHWKRPSRSQGHTFTGKLPRGTLTGSEPPWRPTGTHVHRLRIHFGITGLGSRWAPGDTHSSIGDFGVAHHLGDSNCGQRAISKHARQDPGCRDRQAPPAGKEMARYASEKSSHSCSVGVARFVQSIAALSIPYRLTTR